MSVVVERRDLRTCRDAVVSLFARNGVHYTASHFDWYYSNAVKQTPISWVLRNRGSTEIVGICSVVPRTIHWGETDIAAGVPGDLVVDADSRASFGALDLLRSTQSLVSSGELDLLIGVPSTPALPLAERVGFRRVSVWQSYAQIVNSREKLRSRFGRLGAALSPLADSSAALLRAVKSRSVPRFKVVELSRQGLDRLQTDNWRRPNRCLVSHASSGFLRWRFLDTPVAKYRIFGVLHPRTDQLCGYVVGRASAKENQLVIWDCRTDARHLREADALMNVFWHCRNEGRMFRVESLRASRLAAELRGLGFLRLPPRRGENSPWLVGYWRSDHKLAREFEQPASWKLFRGVNDV